jgi:ribosomal-protein-alanine N-acetyltransferase
MSHASQNPESEDRGGPSQNHEDSPKLPRVDLALVTPAERDAAARVIQELREMCVRVDRMLHRAVEIEILHQYRGEQVQTRNRIEADIKQLCGESKACREWLKVSAEQLHNALVLCAEDLRESWHVASSLARILTVDTSIGDVDLPEDWDAWKPSELKHIIKARALELKDFVGTVWQEVLWLVDGKTEQAGWAPFISRRSVRAAGLEGVVEQLEGVSYRVDSYLNVITRPFPEEVETRDERRRLRRCNRELRGKRRELAQLNQEHIETDKSLMSMASFSSQAFMEIGNDLRAMCGDIATLLKQCQGRSSLIFRELQASEGRVMSLRARIANMASLSTPQERSLAREIVREVETLSQWIDLTQNLDAFGSAQDVRLGSQLRTFESPNRSNRGRNNLLQKGLAGHTEGELPNSGGRELLSLVRSGFGSKLIKESGTLVDNLRGQSELHLRWMPESEFSQVLQIESRASTTPWSLEDLYRHKNQSNCVFMVVETGTRLVGFMLYEFHEEMLRVIKLAVDPQYQRCGVGFLMVARLFDKLGRTRHHIEMEVRENNVQGQRFLKACGFKATAVRPQWFKTPVEDALVFRATYREIEELRKLGRAK